MNEPTAPGAPLPLPPDDRAGMPWSVVIPVKGGDHAKTRLQAPDGVDHSRLATALALDTVAAAAGTVGAGQVVVVTGDPSIAGQVAALGVVVVDDPGGGLNPAIAAGVAHLAAHATDGGVAVLLGDLASVRPADLATALYAAVTHPRAYVPDADDSGTVLLTSTTQGRLVPRFGGRSDEAHRRAGFVRLDLDLPHLRRDVDDEVSLRAALCLGVGQHTAALLAHLMVPDRSPTA
ncbi:2-phospho-L-lactate guanylyltransferase [Lapillicoccus sp.]|uniref:2-phospho-L-lactate guanylyltransferase n=1 Tax=Lapillicoccus sp. TaxID=1909287 RepID=UPI0025D0A8BD|nr:2-phospho-L-lactate guanylyltransferase [Lapillicoccus sp.]